jgi:carbon-monoxide dehydrogenase iron sulfur subunit
MVKALQGVRIHPRIQIEEDGGVSFAVSCRHCEEPLCLKGCITGALSLEDEVIKVDEEKCVGCYTCILSCPYGAIMPSASGSAVQKCELCLENNAGEPACVRGCPNRAIVYEERV